MQEGKRVLMLCLLVPSLYPSHGLMLRQLRQRHVTHCIYAVVVPVLRLVRHVPVTILSPSVAT